MTDGITVLCNDRMIDLLQPSEHSAALTELGFSYIAAIYERADLLAVDADTVQSAGAWWREMGWCNTDIEFDEAEIRRVGILLYLCDRYGISSERNVAVALNDVASNAGMTRIEFANWAAGLPAARTQLDGDRG